MGHSLTPRSVPAPASDPDVAHWEFDASCLEPGDWLVTAQLDLPSEDDLPPLAAQSLVQTVTLAEGRRTDLTFTFPVEQGATVHGSVRLPDGLDLALAEVGIAPSGPWQQPLAGAPLRADGRFDKVAEEGLEALTTTLAQALAQRMKTAAMLPRLYDALAADGVIAAPELDLAQRWAQRKNKDLELVLVDDFGIALATMGKAIARQCGLDYQPLNPDWFPDRELTRKLDRAAAQQQQWLPFKREGNIIAVVTAEPERAVLPRRPAVLAQHPRRPAAPAVEGQVHRAVLDRCRAPSRPHRVAGREDGADEEDADRRHVAGRDVDYAVVECEKKRFIVARSLVETVFRGKEFAIKEEMKGGTLIGKRYAPLFPYFEKQYKGKAFRVVDGSDFVTTDDGTGIVHIATGYGDDDYSVGKREGVEVLQHVGIAVLLGLCVFSFVMAVGHLVFVRRDWFQRATAWLRDRDNVLTRTVLYTTFVRRREA